MKKKYLALLLASVMTVSVMGCASNGTGTANEPSGEAEINSEEAAVEAAESETEENIKTKEEETVMRNASGNVNLNQVGFMPKARKTVVVRGENLNPEFRILDAKTDEEVFKGTLTGPVEAKEAAETVYQGDFSDFTTPGNYVVKVSNDEESYPFEIKDGVYDEALKEIFLFFYKQRCGCEVEESIVGKIAHGPCHTSDAQIYGTKEYKEVNGGWHDAGDYGRYVVAGATSIADMFMAYEDFPEIWKTDSVGIPESGNGIPDILDEARYELDWMLKMQDEATGGVYHKVTCIDFPGYVMPEAETKKLVLAPISPTATGDFAAVMAMASRIYRPFDEEFADKALEVAKKAWDFLEANPGMEGFKNPPEIHTGEYGDGDSSDERYWAAVELLKVTGEQKYKDYVSKALSGNVPFGFGWDTMGTYGNAAYLSLDESLQDAALKDKVLEACKNQANEYLNNVKTDGYMCDLGTNYIWGSNLSVCSFARLMLLVNKYCPDMKEMYTAAYDQISYLFGQNAVSYSFISGFGTNYTQNSHHRPSLATSSLVKGMVAGGPNGGKQDPCAGKALKDAPPAKSYIDHSESYSTNEVAIYWNSPVLYLLSAIISGE
ncbi:endoglucanase [Lachnospiraceae bacterium G11]|nr:endoglucanase [Lachnospiraceae bacterium G11]